MTLADLKPGDLVAYCFRGTMATSPNQMRIRTVTRVTEKLVFVSAYKFRRETGEPAIGSRGWIRLATDEEVAAWHAKIKEEERKRRDREERENLPDYRIACQMTSYVTEQWLKLGLERLKQISDWLDE